MCIRGILVVTCTLVSFFHCSNDGQKGMGLIMLILVGIVPGAFALNMGTDAGRWSQSVSADMARSSRRRSSRRWATVRRCRCRMIADGDDPN